LYGIVESPGLLHNPGQGSLAKYFKTKKIIKRACDFFLFKTLWGEQDFASQHPS